jgi:hypothetical protein
MLSGILTLKSPRRAEAVRWRRWLVALLWLAMALLARGAPVTRSFDDPGRVPQSAANPADTKDSDRLTKEALDLFDQRIMADT